VYQEFDQKTKEKFKNTENKREIVQVRTEKSKRKLQRIDEMKREEQTKEMN